MRGPGCFTDGVAGTGLLATRKNDTIANNGTGVASTRRVARFCFQLNIDTHGHAWHAGAIDCSSATG